MTYFNVDNIIFDVEITAKSKLVYIYLSKCADKKGLCFPAQGKIALNLGISVTSVKSALKELSACGYIKGITTV